MLQTIQKHTANINELWLLLLVMRLFLLYVIKAFLYFKLNTVCPVTINIYQSFICIQRVGNCNPHREFIKLSRPGWFKTMVQVGSKLPQTSWFKAMVQVGSKLPRPSWFKTVAPVGSKLPRPSWFKTTAPKLIQYYGPSWFKLWPKLIQTMAQDDSNYGPS